MADLYVEAGDLVPSVSGKAAVGTVAFIQPGPVLELVVTGESIERRFEVVLDGERIWSAFEVDEDDETPSLVLAGARFQIDPRSLVLDRADRGDLVATAAGWALRCVASDQFHGGRYLDALVAPGALTASRWDPKAYRRWRIVVGTGAAERIVVERRTATK